MNWVKASCNDYGNQSRFDLKLQQYVYLRFYGDGGVGNIVYP